MDTSNWFKSLSNEGDAAYIYIKFPWSSTPLYPSGYKKVWANILLIAGGLNLETHFWVSIIIHTFPLIFISSYPQADWIKRGEGGREEGNPKNPQLNCKTSPQLLNSRGFHSFNSCQPFETCLLSNLFARREVKRAPRSKPESVSVVQCLYWQSGLLKQPGKY